MIEEEHGVLVKYRNKLKEIDRELLALISKRTRLSEDQIRMLEIEVIEEKLKIEAKPPRIYFAWELAQKTGWQLSQSKFVPKKELDRRKKEVDLLLMSTK